MKISETDLYVLADSDLKTLALESAHQFRSQIEEYIRIHPEFRTSLVPLLNDPLAPPVVREMIAASGLGVPRVPR